MDTLSEYFAAKHSALEFEYKVDCLKIAREIARLLLDQGKSPYIMKLEKVEQRGENKYHVPLMPLRYDGAAAFTQHYVCCCDDQVFDPINPQPLKINEYSNTIFGIEIPAKIYVHISEMKNYLVGPARIKARG